MDASVRRRSFLSDNRVRLLLFGAVAYVGLRYMSKKGIMKPQADRALDVIDKGINMAKERFGINRGIIDETLSKETSLSH